MKCCVWCKYFEMEEGGAISEITFEPSSLGCAKNHWYLSGLYEDDFRGYAKLAENCIDFTAVDELKEEVKG